jgi:hypothetical protein
MHVQDTAVSLHHVCELCGTPFFNADPRIRRFCSRSCWKNRSIDHASRFWARIQKTDGCWLWTGATLPNGYGHMNIRSKHWFPHRYAWTLTNGPIPDGLWVLHRCDTPLCCRPDHLFLGTSYDNVQDMIAKGRNSPPPHFSGDEHFRRRRALLRQ